MATEQVPYTFPKCRDGRKHDGSPLRPGWGRTCDNPKKPGSDYCGIHDPKRRAERQEKKDAKRRRETAERRHNWEWGVAQRCVDAEEKAKALRYLTECEQAARDLIAPEEVLVEEAIRILTSDIACAEDTIRDYSRLGGVPHKATIIRVTREKMRARGEDPREQEPDYAREYPYKP